MAIARSHKPNRPSCDRRRFGEQVVLGIDVGGTGIKVAPVDVLRGRLLERRLRVRTPGSASPGKVAAVIDELTQHFKWTAQIGCGMPCKVDKEVIKSGNLSKRWVGKNPTSLLRDVTGCPVMVMNDADAAGFAEMRFGAGKNCQGTVLLVTIGTGIGTALFREGQLLPNIEVVALIPRETRRASDRARRREGLSWKHWARRLNRCLDLLEEALAPDLIILGGGVSKRFDKFGRYLRTKAKLVPAFYRGDAGIVGAAVAAVNGTLRPALHAQAKPKPVAKSQKRSGKRVTSP